MKLKINWSTINYLFINFENINKLNEFNWTQYLKIIYMFDN